MSLSLLPPEILGEVTCYLRSDDLVSLIHVGHVQLIRLLRTYGSVTSLELKIDAKNLSRPQFLLRSFCGLKRLRLGVGDDLSIGSWLHFPNTLTWLQIWPTSQNFLSFDFTAFPVGQLLPNLQYLSVYISLEHHDVDWVRSFPPTLETLEISSWDPSCPLPASLTSLELLYPSSLPSQISSLPHLREIIIADVEKVDFSEISPFWASLPPTLEFLSMVCIPDALSASDIALLPYGLTKLELAASYGGQILIHSDPACIVFPPSLTALFLFGTMEANIFAPFPRSLTDLTITGCHLLNEAFLMHFATLIPPTLLTLWLDGANHQLKATIPLPKSLTKLELRNTAFHLSVLTSLPKTITVLAIGPIWTEDNDASLVWPLETFSLPALVSIWYNSLKPISVSFLRCLAVNSPRLTDFCMNNVKNTLSPFSGWDWVVQKDPKDYLVFSKAFASLPPLQSLNDVPTASGQSRAEQESENVSERTEKGSIIEIPSSSQPIQDSGSKCLPFRFNQRLTTFSAMPGTFGDELVATLPHSLTTLILPSCSSISDISFTTTIQHCHALEHLICSSPCITGSVFPILPRELKFLALPASALISDDHLLHLPPSITSLHLQSAERITDKCGPHLPRNLKLFRLDLNETVTEHLSRFLVQRGEAWLYIKGGYSYVVDGKATHNYIFKHSHLFDKK